jgi:halimadienyl-diphosphate synthase
VTGPDGTARRFDVLAATRRLIVGMMARPWGQVSPSIYETARLVSLQPNLSGQAGRLDFLRGTQRSDGAWGTGHGYDLVPTLSATEALLRSLDRGDDAIADTVTGRDGLRRTAAAGLYALRRRLPTTDRQTLPDMPAIEVIVPGLVEAINELLADGAGAADPLPVPAGMRAGVLALIRGRLAEGAPIEPKLAHALEVAGPAARGALAVTPAPTGAVGASPAATAAWVDAATGAGTPAWAYLEATVAQGGAGVPCTSPITVFERAWVLANLARAGLDPRPPAELIAQIQAALGHTGAATSPGLPPDADTTAMTLFALGQLGLRPDVECLRGYELTTHFCTWQGEDGTSTTVNAHVLEALGLAGLDPTAGPWPLAAAAKAADWLVAAQEPDGSWRDRWHASPYYATAACVQSLAEFGQGRTKPDCLSSAVDWVLDHQRDDGSWGVWEATVEETAYAVQALIGGAGRDRRIGPAVRRGLSYLIACVSPAPIPTDDNSLPGEPSFAVPALWHDKDLYAPAAIVSSAAIAAIHVAHGYLEAIVPGQRRPSSRPFARIPCY